MKRNFAPVQIVETPIYDQDVDYYDDLIQSYPGDPNQSLRQRMMLILAIVILVTFSLGFIALPATSQYPSGNQNNNPNNLVESNDSNIIQEQFISQTSLSTDGIGGSQIAGFFTPEVHYWDAKIMEWANLHGLNPNAIATIMQIESCGDPGAVSIAGARGLFQVMPFHFTDSEDMHDPDTNAMRGMNFLNEQLRYTGGDILLSFAGYNGGYAASGGAYANWPNETQRYYGWAKGIYEDAEAGLEQSETLDAWLAAGGSAGCQRAANSLDLN